MAHGMQCDMLQVCVVVNNLDEAMKRYSDLLGIGPFVVYTVDSQEVPGITRDGQPTNYCVRVGMAKIGNGILELLENLRGQTIWKDFYDKHGEGVHHIGLVTSLPRFPTSSLADSRSRWMVQSQASTALAASPTWIRKSKWARRLRSSTSPKTCWNHSTKAVIHHAISLSGTNRSTFRQRTGSR
jgi:hypothetical protein